jgi:uncharacterized protein
MDTTHAARQELVEKLCPACGLCCNGVLFGDVELQRGDDPKHLRELGLTLFQKGRKKCFHQPCSCFDGSRCRIYEDRPHYCRAFECRLLMRVEAGEVSVPDSLKAIAETRKVVESVRRLVRELGNHEEDVALNLRYAAAVSQPVDLADGRGRMSLQGRLLRAVEKLAGALERHFLA